MFDTSSGWAPGGKDNQGRFVLDRNPNLFEVVLEWLRTGVVEFARAHVGIATMERVRAEADFFGLVNLTKEVQNVKRREESVTKEGGNRKTLFLRKLLDSHYILMCFINPSDTPSTDELEHLFNCHETYNSESDQPVKDVGAIRVFANQNGPEKRQLRRDTGNKGQRSWYFFERNPKLFEVVLEWLRSGVVHIGKDSEASEVTLVGVREEAEFLGLVNLAQEVQGMKMREESSVDEDGQYRKTLILMKCPLDDLMLMLMCYVNPRRLPSVDKIEQMFSLHGYIGNPVCYSKSFREVHRIQIIQHVNVYKTRTRSTHEWV
ncbi:hypothetical protein M427DRAFT_44236 [Gonapodya prolifera JEL478]|uniref:Potassium channel tetramerisation-type BTB domain-containing protein n=1 Tax=Gonapodya prolifera (strain JEL478) TaxID=1344416 RepID=A0A139AGD6_GONPJ|nr:hypothetical protein M427DRAFT_44236 [Gonapodya prolifera JEL478]|eukprot:KXS15871.1 hypothetical protein M427DRAFT_44236 [Gonapodya prolifera JEL478]